MTQTHPRHSRNSYLAILVGAATIGIVLAWAWSPGAVNRQIMLTEDGLTKTEPPSPIAAINDEPLANQDNTESQTMSTIRISNAHVTLTATLENNEAVKQLESYFPLTMAFTEWNGNEIYRELPWSLPAAPQKVGTIHAGDIMLYGDDTLVIFYQDFTTTYEYTPLGHITESEDLSVLVSDPDSITLELAPPVTPDLIGMPNPVVTYPDMSAATAAVGFALSVPEFAPGLAGDVSVIAGKILQIDSTSGNMKMMIRKAAGTDDISGDYNVYSQHLTLELAEGFSVDTFGDNDTVARASWQRDGYTYSLMVDPAVSLKQMHDWIVAIR